MLLSVCDRDKPELIEIAKQFSDLGFRIIATGKSYEMIREAGIPADKIFKIYEGRPNITDEIANGEIQLIINTPAGKTSIHDDSYIRKTGCGKGKCRGNTCYQGEQAFWSEITSGSSC